MDSITLYVFNSKTMIFKINTKLTHIFWKIYHKPFIIKTTNTKSKNYFFLFQNNSKIYIK